MRRPTTVLRIAALATSATLVMLSAAPGTAAQPLAKGTAVGLSLTVGGTANDSGAYTVSNDGSGESRSGARDPQIRLAGGQDAAQVGTVAQNARTEVRNGRGFVVACAGLAGDGATVAEVGEGNCLAPGDNLRLNDSTFDLSTLTIAEGEALEPLREPLSQIEEPLREQLLSQADDAIQQALAAIGIDVGFDVGAIQSTCEADDRRAVGDATLTDVNLSVAVQGEEFQVVDFPVNPPPNTKIVTELDQVVDAINEGLRTQLTNGLNGALQDVPLGDAVDEVNDNVIAQVAPQLGELEKNLVDGTLNKQVRPRDRAIEVTALELRLLPAATEAAGGDLLATEIGKTTCATADAAAPPPPVAPPAAPDVPTSVPSGLADAPADDSGLPAEVALAGLALVAGAVGVGAYRRRLTD